MKNKKIEKIKYMYPIPFPLEELDLDVLVGKLNEIIDELNKRQEKK